MLYQKYRQPPIFILPRLDYLDKIKEAAVLILSTAASLDKIIKSKLKFLIKKFILPSKFVNVSKLFHWICKSDSKKLKLYFVSLLK